MTLPYLAVAWLSGIYLQSVERQTSPKGGLTKYLWAELGWVELEENALSGRLR